MPHEHTVFLGLGGNLGDRQVNLARAIGQLKRHFDVVAVSPAYETEPVGFVDQPKFLNLVVRATTDRSPQAVLRQLKDVEFELGRRREPGNRYGPRPIDLDLLFYDDLVLDDPAAELRLPHPEIAGRAFVLVPLADLAPDWVHPGLGATVRALLGQVPAAEKAGVRRLDRGLLVGFSHDVQNQRPQVALGLERVGVTGIERMIQLETAPGKPLYAVMELFVELAPFQKGAHMSRFPDMVDEALEGLAAAAAPDLESLAGEIAEGLVRRQSARKAEVSIRAKVPRVRYTPLSGLPTQDLFVQLGWAVSDGRSTAKLLGVEVEGMTACPCAQDMIRDHARTQLIEAGFDAPAAEKALGVVTLATHSQRSVGRVVISSHPSVSAEDLLAVVEASMSSEIYELLKRPDEFYIVNQAHRNPKFVEDVVRDMLGHVVDMCPDLPGDAFVVARQRNFESIHHHDVYAERGATLGDLRRELGGGEPGASLRLEQWLSDQALRRGTPVPGGASGATNGAAKGAAPVLVTPARPPQP